MRQLVGRSLIILFFLFLQGGIVPHAIAQTTITGNNSPVKTPEQLKKDLDNKVISQVEFLDKVDSWTSQYFNSPQFAGLLSRYRDIAWSNSRFEENRIRYFLLMAAYNMNSRDYGSTLFYYQKGMEEAIGAHKFPYVFKAYLGQVLIDRDLHNWGQLAKDLEKGDFILNYIITHRNSIVMTGDEWVVICILLESGQMLYNEWNDKPRSDHYFRQFGEIVSFLNHHPAANPDDREDFRVINYKYEVARGVRHKATRQTDSALADLHRALAITSSGNVYRLMDANMDIYSELIELYLAENNLDSAAAYIRRYDQYRKTSVKFDLSRFLQEDSYTSHSYFAELYERRGDLTNALHHRKEATKVQDSIYQDMTMDYFNNLYAKAQMVYNKEQLVKAELAKNKAERINLLLFLSVALVILLAVLIFYRYKFIQRQRFIESKLGMARNIHDEIAPMLLYTRMLVKAENRETGTVPSFYNEMDMQISRTLDSVRMLAHELRSDAPYTLAAFYTFIQEQLRKNEKINKIIYRLETDSAAIAISAYQYDHLKKIFSELVANTIKHTDCRLISVRAGATGKTIRLFYSDDGPGIPEQFRNNGIGLKNIEERVAQLHGSFCLENHYPEGYHISIEIPGT